MTTTQPKVSPPTTWSYIDWTTMPEVRRSDSGKAYTVFVPVIVVRFGAPDAEGLAYRLKRNNAESR